MRRVPLYVGLVIAMLSGLVLGYAWLGDNAAWWWIGALSLLSAALMALSGVHMLGGPTGLQAAARRRGGRPLLGELLTRKYRLITQADLERGLAQQRKTRDRLGMVLVQMGLLTLEQLAEVLEEQISHEAAADPAPQPQA